MVVLASLVLLSRSLALLSLSSFSLMLSLPLSPTLSNSPRPEGAA